VSRGDVNGFVHLGVEAVQAVEVEEVVKVVEVEEVVKVVEAVVVARA
jgi:hypothetical protein